MNFWVIADTHFGHDKIKAFESRPEDHEQQILRNLSLMVKPDDVLIHLGDVAFYDKERWADLLRTSTPGTNRWLIRGNHDKESLTWYLEHGWSVVADRLDLKVFGLRLSFSHRPLPDADDYDLNIHGHHHLSGHHPEDAVTTKHRLVFCEHHYAPVKLRTIVGV